MKNWLLAVTAPCLVAATAFAGELDDRVAASRAAVKEFATHLQGELSAAIQAGGPTSAIEVCSRKAPAIAAKIAQEKGWQVGRTSLKWRSPANAPDAWEIKVLKAFEARKAKGEDPAQMEFSETVKANGKRQFRYMKAIAMPAAAPCLLCHGEALDPLIAAKLKSLYPQDRATGYKSGDLRGAFTIRQPL